MNELVKDIQMRHYLAQLGTQSDPLEVDLAQLIAQNQTIPAGTPQEPITVTTEQPIPTQPVFSLEKYLIEELGSLGAIIVVLFLAAKYFNLGALISNATTYLKSQNSVAEALLADSKKMRERFEAIDSTHRRVEQNHEELIKIRHQLDSLVLSVQWFVDRRSLWDKPTPLEPEQEDELRRRRHS